MRVLALAHGVLCLLVSGIAKAQTRSQVFAGTAIGHYVMDSFYSEPEKKIDLFDLRGKLVILDFWNVSCKACIASMPKMEKLQKEFADRLQILLVTKNSTQQIESLFSKIKLRKPDVPIVTDEGLYSRLFPHEGDPLHVWIYPDGVVRYVAEAYNTTKENIERALAGKTTLEMSERESLPGFDRNRSLLELTPNLIRTKLSGYSLVLTDLYNYPNEVGVGISMTRDSTTGYPIMLRALNYSIYRLFSLAYSRDLFDFDVGQTPPAQNNWILDETGDQLRFPEKPGQMEGWLKRNVVCYELLVPPERSGEFFKIMKQDVNRYFGYRGAIEKKRVKCLVLKEKFGKNTGQNVMKGASKQTTVKDLHNNNSLQLLKQLVYSLQSLSMPVVFDAGLGGTKMPLNGGLSDLTAIRKELKKRNLTLVQETREISVLVIKRK